MEAEREDGEHAGQTGGLGGGTGATSRPQRHTGQEAPRVECGWSQGLLLFIRKNGGATECGSVRDLLMSLLNSSGTKL